MTSVAELRSLYLDYLDCLNTRRWSELGDFVGDDVHYNGRRLGLATYRDQRIAETRSIPDLRFAVGLLACEPPRVAAQLRFECSPRGEFLGLRVDGRTVSFTENVFYTFTAQKITEVWSVIDKAAVEAQLG
jgi:predicted ester cyclase